MIRCAICWIVATAVLLVPSLSGTASQQKAGDAAALVIVDANGKEHKLKEYKYSAGTARLPWLATEAPDPKNKGKASGPEYLEFVEGKSAPLKKGVTTWLALSSLRRIDFDAAKGTMTVRVAKNDKEADDEVLVGQTGYQGINQLAIEALVDLGELGTAAVQFQGGGERGIKSVLFPSPKPLDPLPAERTANIKHASKTQTGHKVSDLQALYKSGTGHKLMPTLFFKETIKLDLGKVDKMALQNGAGSIGFDVTLKSGQQVPLILIERPKDGDGKAELQLVGLLGKFSGGYRLFPVLTVGELQFEGK